MGNKICKEHSIKAQEPSTTEGKWADVKKSALTLAASEDTQVDQFLRVTKKKTDIDADETEKPAAQPKTILKRPEPSKTRDNSVDDLAKMLSDLRIQHIESQQAMQQMVDQRVS